MPQKPGRPSFTVTIEDCSSCLIVANQTPLCPHGLAWRPSRWEAPKPLPSATAEQREAIERYIASVCADAACEADEYQPHAGQKIVLRAPRDVAWRAMLEERREECAGDANRLVELAYGILEDVLVEWTWTGIDGERLPHPSAEGALEEIRRNTEGAEAVWIISALTAGGDPYAAEVAQGNGDAGSQNT